MGVGDWWRSNRMCKRKWGIGGGVVSAGMGLEGLMEGE